MTAREIYFEDLDSSYQRLSPEHRVDADEMLEFNRRFDPWPFHVDEAAARDSPFGGLIASGGYIVALMYRLGHVLYDNAEERWRLVGGLGGPIRFQRPVRPGDRLRLRLTIIDRRVSSGGRGIVTARHELINQDDALVYVCDASVVIQTRSAA